MLSFYKKEKTWGKKKTGLKMQIANNVEKNFFLLNTEAILIFLSFVQKFAEDLIQEKELIEFVETVKKNLKLKFVTLMITKEHFVQKNVYTNLIFVNMKRGLFILVDMFLLIFLKIIHFVWTEKKEELKTL